MTTVDGQGVVPVGNGPHENDADTRDGPVSGIVEFIQARLAKDEADAERPRDLREVEAKRAILAEHQPKLCRNCAYMCDVPCCSGCGQTNPCPTLRALASIWSDHPDYDPAWRQE